MNKFRSDKYWKLRDVVHYIDIKNSEYLRVELTKNRFTWRPIGYDVAWDIASREFSDYKKIVNIKPISAKEVYE